MHACHVQPLVGVRDEVAEARGSHETIGQRFVDERCRLQAPKRVGVALGRPGSMRHACGDGKVDDDLRRLLQVEDHRVGRVAGCDELIGSRRQLLGDTRKMAFERERPFGENGAIDRAHPGGVSRTRA